jgi:hypothetical protein
MLHAFSLLCVLVVVAALILPRERPAAGTETA